MTVKFVLLLLQMVIWSVQERMMLFYNAFWQESEGASFLIVSRSLRTLPSLCQAFCYRIWVCFASVPQGPNSNSRLYIATQEDQRELKANPRSSATCPKTLCTIATSEKVILQPINMAKRSLLHVPVHSYL